MRNIFLFIRRYFNFLLFVILQVVSLSLLFKYNKFHEAAFMGVASEVTGRFNERFNTIEYYFTLKKENEKLVKENEVLRNRLQQDFEPPDTAARIVIDSIRIDSLEKYRRYRYNAAKVVGSIIHLQTNYLMVHRGSAQGVAKDDGVVGPQGIVGRVVAVSENFATVMLALNRQFRTSVKLKKGGERGSIEWDGNSPQFLILKDIQKSAAVTAGDTVITSELSSIFPPNVMVGTVQNIINDNSSNFYTIRLKTATNFSNIQYVYVVKDLQRDEKAELENQTRQIR